MHIFYDLCNRSNINWWDGTIKLFAGLQSSASIAAASQSSSQSGSESASSNDGGAAASATSDSLSVNEAAAHIVVEGANIDKFEGSLRMSGASLQSIDTKAVAEVLADAYASSYAAAFASSYVQASASAAYSMGLHIGWPADIDWGITIPIGQSYQTVYRQVYASLFAQFNALAEAQAEAVVKLLSSAELKVNLGVQFEDIPGNTDLLKATGNTSAVLTCDLSKSLSSSANVEE